MTDLLLIVIALVLVNHFALTPGSLSGLPTIAPVVLPRIALTTGAVLVCAGCVYLLARNWVLAPLAAGHLGLLLAVALAAAGATLALQIGESRTAAGPASVTERLLVTANGSVLILSLERGSAGFGAIAVLGVAVSLAAAFALLLMALSALFERIAADDVPQPFRGAPIALVAAGLTALALLGLSGLLPG